MPDRCRETASGCSYGCGSLHGRVATVRQERHTPRPSRCSGAGSVGRGVGASLESRGVIPPHEALVEELAELIAIPSVSADPAHADDVRRAADWVVARITRGRRVRPRSSSAANVRS